MKVALMHYHLRPGGVTTVIRDQCRSLAGDVDCLVLSGEPPTEGDGLEMAEAVSTVPGIGYAVPGATNAGAGRMAAGIRAAMMKRWGCAADLLHVHNPVLNKNPNLLGCLRALQEGGMKILVQVHDFAEEGRPGAAYPQGEPYPADCHYAVINSRDQDALLASGLRPGGVHVLYNAVGDLGSNVRRIPRGPRHGLLYPVRGIRRKNVGEALLLGVLLDTELSITLPPRNPVDLSRFEEWRGFAGSHGVRARFGAGLSSPLEVLIAESSAAVTTSVNEGFGFAFLEPWTAGLQVVGRRVTHACRDFEAAGVQFPAFYDSVPVPIDLFDEPRFAERWKEAVQAAFSGFGTSGDPGTVARALTDRVKTGSLDFAFLDEEAQRQVISRVLSDNAARKRLSHHFPELQTIGAAIARPDPAIAASNKAVILSTYSLALYGRRLREVYRSACEVAIQQKIDRRTLLDWFLQPGRFRILESR